MGDPVDVWAATRSLEGGGQRPEIASPSGDTATGTLAEGDRVGRYLVRRCIGSGGMGVVYEALDESLGRRVALKLVGRDAAPPDAARLVREARAAAALSHPHVVSVYEVGSHASGPFLAMELVDGVNLREWLAARPRGWREIVGVFRQAGLGLAAAHRAGLVHRDVKPGNILVGTDRVRVADFGLARSVAEPRPEGEPAPARDDDSITHAGAVVGTPRYMAPEQRAGRAVDARSDEYGFCVSLFEALAGAAPPRDRPPAFPAAVPPWLRRVLARGLAVDPAARYPSMDALISDVDRDRRVRWWRAAGGGAFAAGAVAALAFAVPSREPPCRGAEAQLAGVWDAGVRTRVGATLAALGPGWAPATAREVGRTLDRYAADWVGMHRAACEATRVNGEQSEAMLDRRVACLEQRRGALGMLVRDLAQLDAAGLEGAPRLLRALPRVSDCGDLAALAAGPPPRSDALARQVDEQLMTARMHHLAARDEAGIVAGRQAVDGARRAGDARREAEALLILGRLQIYVDGGAAIDSLGAAADGAGRAGSTGLKIEAWGYLAQAYMRVGRMPEAGRVLELAFAALRDAPDRPREADLCFARGTFHGRSGRFAEALADFERALAIWTELHGPDSHALSAVHSNATIALRRLGRLPESLAHARRAFELARLLGDDNPEAVSARDDLAAVLGEMGRLAEARVEAEAVVAALRRIEGPPHARLAMAEGTLGTTLARSGLWRDAAVHHLAALELGGDNPGADAASRLRRRVDRGQDLVMTGKPAEGEPMLREALDGRIAMLGADHVDVGISHQLLGHALLALGRVDEALAQHERALAIVERALGPDHVQLASVLGSAAEAHRARGQAAHALRLDERAQAILEKALPAEHPDRVAARIDLARDHLALGAAARARALAAEAVRAAADNPQHAGAARWVLARASWEAGGDRPRSLELARAARADLERAGTPREIADIDRWLAARPRAD